MVQGAKSAISNLLYGSSVCTNDNHSLRACVDKKNGFGWPRDFREEDF